MSTTEATATLARESTASETASLSSQHESLPPRPLMRNRIGDARNKGEAPFDALIVGGTLSLGVMMMIGGLVILILSLADQSSWNVADTDDFQSLGPQGCRVERTVEYSVQTYELDALNSVCREEYQYFVRVVATNTSFVSTKLSAIRCTTSCDVCFKFYGPNWYIGVESTRLGEPITNETLIQCWEPTKPVSDLSDFYQCGILQDDGGGMEVSPQEAASSCYQLEDTSIELRALQNSNQAGMIAAVVGLAGAVIMLSWWCFFVYKNRQARILDEMMSDEEEQGDAQDGLE